MYCYCSRVNKIVLIDSLLESLVTCFTLKYWGIRKLLSAQAYKHTFLLFFCTFYSWESFFLYLYVVIVRYNTETEMELQVSQYSPSAGSQEMRKGAEIPHLPFWKVRESFQRQDSLWQQQIRNYYVTDLELLAVLQALFHFKCFLLHTDNICFWEYREQTQSLFDVI